jgi:hypothetical protein
METALSSLLLLGRLQPLVLRVPLCSQQPDTVQGFSCPAACSSGPAQYLLQPQTLHQRLAGSIILACGSGLSELQGRTREVLVVFLTNVREKVSCSKYKWCLAAMSSISRAEFLLYFNIP